MSVTLDEKQIDVGATTTATGTIEEASDGVGAAELTISVVDASVATVADVTVLGEGASNGESTHPLI